MPTTIAIERVALDITSVRSAITRALANISANALVAGKSRILLKPNLFIAKAPEAGLTTHPVVIEAVIDWLTDYGIPPEAITVGESSSSLSSSATKRAFKVCGIQELCERKGVRWTPFEGTPMVRVDLPRGKLLDHVDLSAELAHADFVINLPVFKTHAMTIITGAIKNMFGSLVLTNKTHMHGRFPAFPDFAEMLVDVYSATTPALTIVDGLTGIEGNGPGAGGKKVDLGLVIAGTDPVAVDTIITEIMGFDHDAILSTKAATARGLGTNLLAEIEVIGVPLTEVKKKFEFPGSYKRIRLFFNSRVGRALTPMMRKFTQVRAWYDKKCVSCGNCVAICPGHALLIRQSGDRPTWTRAKCINCHCCEEVCPQGAAHVSIAGIRGVWTYSVLILGGLAVLIYLLAFFI